MISDIRVGLRLLWRDKAFALTVALTLALCIGANTALFSVVHNVLLRPLPVPESDRIVLMGNAYPGAGPAAAAGANSGVPDYYDRLRETDVFEEQALYNGANQSIDQNGTPLRVRVTRVSPSFFRLLRIPPALGRTFSEAEGEVGNDKKVVLSYALWQSQFGGDPSVVGKDIRMDGQPFTVVGVMPKGFYFLNPNVMLWRPLAFTQQQKSDEQRHSNNYQNIGRLKPGASIQRARQQIDALNTRNLEKFPALKPLLINAGFHTTVVPLQETVVRDVKATLYLMWGGALFVLLIGCVNVANLSLVRSRARLKELATRLALGAGRRRVARQLIVESVLLTLVAAAAGLAIGYAALRLLGTLSIQELPRGEEIRLDGVVAAYTIATAAAIGFVLGLIPVASVLPANLTLVLREEGRAGTSGRGARTLRRGLVVAQVAFAFVLLVGAGLLIRSYERLQHVNPGFDPGGVVTFNLSLPEAKYPTVTQIGAFTASVVSRLQAEPGVEAAAAIFGLPFAGDFSASTSFRRPSQPDTADGPSAGMRVVTPAYFKTMRVPLVAGRLFDAHDDEVSPEVVLINQRTARRFFPDEDPIGQQIRIGVRLARDVRSNDKTIVGIVGDVKYGSLDAETPPEVYLPYAQHPVDEFTIAVRVAGDPMAFAPTLRRDVAALDRELPIAKIEPMTAVIGASIAERRFTMWLLTAFAAAAVALATIGIYGVLAYLVGQRTQEIGVRLAIGATPGNVVALFVREGAALTLVGVVSGVAGALAVTRALSTLLFGVTTTDPATFAAVAGALAAVALLASYVPARRAARVDPMTALRND